MILGFLQPGLWLLAARGRAKRGRKVDETRLNCGLGLSDGLLRSTEALAFRDPVRSAPLKVLLWHWGRIGAGAKFSFELAQALHELDIPISVSASAGSDLDVLCCAAKIPLDRVRTFDGRKGRARGNVAAVLGMLNIPALAADFLQALEARQPSVALCAFQSIWDVAAVQAMRRFTGRFVLILHDASFHPGDDYPLRAKVLAREVGAADGLIVLSEHVGSEAQTRFGFPADRIWTVPHGTFSFAASRTSSRRHPRRRALRILFLGRILDYKGLSILIEAYRILRDRRVPVTLNIAGEGDMAPYTQALATLADVEIDNRWLDEAEIGLSLARADIVVLPYIEASQSGVAAAAMTEALPVVVTPVGGLVEQVAHEETGLVAAAIDAAAVGLAIERLVQDVALYDHCSRGALRYAQNDLSWGVIGKKVRAAIEDVASRPRRVPR